MLFQSTFMWLALMLSVFKCVNKDFSQQNNIANLNTVSYKIKSGEFEKFLSNQKGSTNYLYLDNKERGGSFKLVYDKQIKDDSGMIFPATAKGKDWHWVRDYSADDPVNIRFYGAKGIGLQGYKDDSAAFVKAVDFIKSKGGGKLYIPASSSFYGFNGDGLLLPDNTEVYGDGPNSQVKHVNPESGTFYRGVIFYTTTYGPVNTSSIVREPTYPIEDAPKHQEYVSIKNNADLSNLKTGEIIALGAGYFFKRKNENKARYTNFEINEITKIENNNIYLKYPLSVPLRTSLKSGNSATSSPVIIDVNGNHTFNKKMNAYDRISKNIYIHDLALSQADYNMIDNKPYQPAQAPNTIIGLGGTFESKFSNLTLESVGTFGGNMFNRCEISNLKIYSSKKFTDLGYGSANTKMHDIVWEYKAGKIVDTSNLSFVYLNDGTHDIEIYNVKASGDWEGVNLFVIAGGAHDINIHDVDINLPKMNNPKRVAIMINDDDKITYSHDVVFKNVTIRVGGVKKYIEVNGTNQVDEDKKIVFDNVSFKGRILNRQAHAISIANSSDVNLDKVQMTEGDILLDNAGSAKIENLDAPQATIINTNGNGKKPQVLTSKYKGLKNGY